MAVAPRIEYEDVQSLMRTGAQVLDALPSHDHRKQHIAGSLSVPLEEFSSRLLDGIESGRATITYCADNQCDLSARLAARLVFEGFTEVYEYAASLADWAARGGPLEGEDADVARAGNLARRDFPACGPSERVAAVLQRMGDHTICVVVDGDGILLGRVCRQDIDPGCEALVREVMRPGPSTFRPDVYLSEMAGWFRKRPKTDAFIISTPDGRPFGILYRRDVERAASRDDQRRIGTANRL